MDIIAEPQPRVKNPPEMNDVESLHVDTTTTPRIDITTPHPRSEEHTSELQSRETISYAVFCLKKKKNNNILSLPYRIDTVISLTTQIDFANPELQ